MPRPLPPIISLADLAKADLTPPVPIIEGVLDKGSKLILIGSSKACKTWSLMDMAFCVSQPVPEWWGMRVTPCKVLYINFELKDWRFRERMQEIARSHGFEALTNGQMDVWNLRGFTRNYAELCTQIKERLGKDSGYGLIIVDPLYKFNSSSKVENDATDMTAVMNSLENLAVELEAAIAFAHHSPKGDMEDRDVLDRGSGSGVLTRDPDAILDIRKIKGTYDEFKAEFRLRDFPPKEPLGLRFTFPVMKVDGEVDVKKGAAGRKDDEAALLKLLPASGYRSKDWAEAAFEKLGMSRATFHRHKSALHMKDMAECSENIWIPMRNGKV